MIRVDGFGRAYFFGGDYFLAAGANLDADALAEVSATIRGGIYASIPSDAPLAAAPRGGLFVEFEP